MGRLKKVSGCREKQIVYQRKEDVVNGDYWGNNQLNILEDKSHS